MASEAWPTWNDSGESGFGNIAADFLQGVAHFETSLNIAKPWRPFGQFDLAKEAV